MTRLARRALPATAACAWTTVQSDAQWYGQRAEMLSAVLASLRGER